MKCFFFCCGYGDYSVEIKLWVSGFKFFVNLKMDCFLEVKKSLIRGLKMSGLRVGFLEGLCEEFDRFFF